MKKPIRKTLYECPYCHDFERYDIDEVKNHIAVCECNDTLPPKDCINCGHHSTSNPTQLCGHDRGRQVPCKVLRHRCDIKQRNCENRAGFYCSDFVPVSLQKEA